MKEILTSSFGSRVILSSEISQHFHKSKINQPRVCCHRARGSTGSIVCGMLWVAVWGMRYKVLRFELQCEVWDMWHDVRRAVRDKWHAVFGMQYAVWGVQCEVCGLDYEVCGVWGVRYALCFVRDVVWVTIWGMRYVARGLRYDDCG